MNYDEMGKYGSWTLGNNVILEENFTNSLHRFDVAVIRPPEEPGKLKYIGSIYPADGRVMNQMIDKLMDGKNPVNEHWDDGLGRKCKPEGWCTDEMKYLPLAVVEHETKLREDYVKYLIDTHQIKVVPYQHYLVIDVPSLLDYLGLSNCKELFLYLPREAR